MPNPVSFFVRLLFFFYLRKELLFLSSAQKEADYQKDGNEDQGDIKGGLLGI